MSAPAAAISVFRCARLGWKPFSRRLANPASKPPMKAPTRRRQCESIARHHRPFVAEVRIRRRGVPVLGLGDALLQIGECRRHLGVGGIGDAPALDLDGAHAAIAGRQQRVTLDDHLFQGHGSAHDSSSGTRAGHDAATLPAVPPSAVARRRRPPRRACPRGARRASPAPPARATSRSCQRSAPAIQAAARA